MMLQKVAWRNIWRNKRRSFIVISSIVVGVVALILLDTLSVGFVYQMMNNHIGSHTGHIQVHARGYFDNPVLENVMRHPEPVEKILPEIPHIKHYGKRLSVYGLVSSSYNSSGVSIVGIEPEKEKHLTTIAQFVIEGRYISDAPHEILLSKKLAEKLEVGLGDKVVTMAATENGDVGSQVYRVVGIYETYNSEFDKTHIYIPLAELQKMVELPGAVSEFVMIVDDLKQLNAVKSRLEAELSDEFEVMTYREMLPLVVMYMDIYYEFIIIYYFIIGIGLIFGIINTILMAVFERVTEFGVLMAIGMPNRKIFGMVVWEALFLGIIGTVVGTVLGYAGYLYLAQHGLDLSIFAESLKSFGIGAILYPVMEGRVIVTVFSTIPFFALLGALYPAYKAIRLEPMEAIRYV